MTHKFMEEEMPLFLVTCVCDEGVYKNSFRVVQAPSRLAVAEQMLRHPYHWDDFLDRSYIWEDVRDGRWNAERLLKEMDNTHVDGDSRYQMRIYEIEKLEHLDTT